MDTQQWRKILVNGTTYETRQLVTDVHQVRLFSGVPASQFGQVLGELAYISVVKRGEKPYYRIVGTVIDIYTGWESAITRLHLWYLEQQQNVVPVVKQEVAPELPGSTNRETAPTIAELPKDWLRAEEVAKLLNVSVFTVKDRMQKGLLHPRWVRTRYNTQLSPPTRIYHIDEVDKLSNTVIPAAAEARLNPVVHEEPPSVVQNTTPPEGYIKLDQIACDLYGVAQAGTLRKWVYADIVPGWQDPVLKYWWVAPPKERIAPPAGYLTRIEAKAAYQVGGNMTIKHWAEAGKIASWQHPHTGQWYFAPPVLNDETQVQLTDTDVRDSTDAQNVTIEASDPRPLFTPDPPKTLQHIEQELTALRAAVERLAQQLEQPAPKVSLMRRLLGGDARWIRL